MSREGADTGPASSVQEPQPMDRNVIPDVLYQILHEQAERHAEESDRSSCLSDNSVEPDRAFRLHLAEYIEITTPEVPELKERAQKLEDQLPS